MATTVNAQSNLNTIPYPLTGYSNPITIAQAIIDGLRDATDGNNPPLELNHILTTHQFAVVITDPPASQGGLGGTTITALSAATGFNYNNPKSILKLLSGGFSDVTLPQITEEYMPIRPVNRQLPSYLPLRAAVEGATLSRGLTIIGSPLYMWIDQYLHNYSVVPQYVYVYQLTRSLGGLLIPVNVWTLINAQPVQVRVGPAFKGMGAQLAVEEIAFNVEDIKFDSLADLTQYAY